MKKRVVIHRCASYNEKEVYEAVKGAITPLGGINGFVKKGERVLLKPNLLAGRPPEAAVTTHPSVVLALITLVKEAGATPVVGDSPGIGNARKTAEKCGVLDVCRTTGTELIDLRDCVSVENPSGSTFKRLEVAREIFNVAGIINLPKLKTHAQMYLTLGVKNLFGCVPGKRKPQWHLSAGVDSLYFASMILDLYLFLKPRLTVMDGIVGMEGNGPGNGDPRHMGLIFASSDAVAMDAVIAEVVGAKPQDLPILKAAGLMGMKQADVHGVEVLGVPLDSARVRGFRFPPVVGVNFAERLPYFIDKRLRKALTSRPHIDHGRCTLCTVCMEVCPASVMSKTKRIDIDYNRCIRCYCCQEMCPQGAISSKEGWLKRIIPGL